MAIILAVSLIGVLCIPLLNLNGTAHAAPLISEAFSGISTPSNAWISGGSGGSVACLTAATSSASNSIPACSGGPLDSVGSGVLRLTPSVINRSGFAIYNTPISAEEGLNISFDMYQYNGNGADGISFFLIDGSASPTQPGALGGALGYSSSSNGENPGIVGGYVGVGFDKYGNFSSSDFGNGGPGALGNAIVVRGSEDTGYQYVTRTPANGQLATTGSAIRTNAKRHVVISVSTGNIMTVSVNYFDGNGLQVELSNIDLNTINGEGSLPESFKFGFAASTGGSYNTHEIQGLSVATLNPNVSINASNGGGFKQGGTGQVLLTASNDAGAEASTGTITVTNTLPAGLTPTAASGTGWSCDISGQTVTCTRSDVLSPGASAPVITVDVSIATDATSPLVNTASVSIADNDNLNPQDTDSISVISGDVGDGDMIFDAIEAASPNSGDANDDGFQDAAQANVTSLPNPVTGKYAVLESSCTTHSNVSSQEATELAKEGGYSYPAGTMSFTLSCGDPGETATVTQYYYGTFDPSAFEFRKLNFNAGAYQSIPGAVMSTVSMGGESALKVVYEIIDGGVFDSDSTANGSIVDPSGPARLAAVATPVPTVSPTALPTATSAAVLAAGVPDTGMEKKSLLSYYSAALLGLALLFFELRRLYLAKATKQ
jgi:hypothetical protein